MVNDDLEVIVNICMNCNYVLEVTLCGRSRLRGGFEW